MYDVRFVIGHVERVFSTVVDAKHCKLNLCPECCKEERSQYIKICEFCSLKGKVIDFSSFYIKSSLLTK